MYISGGKGQGKTTGQICRLKAGVVTGKKKIEIEVLEVVDFTGGWGSGMNRRNMVDT